MCTGTHSFIPAADVAQVRMQYSTPGGVAENVLYFRHVDGYSTDELNSLAAAAKGWFTDVLKGYVGADVNLVQIVVTDMSSNPAPQVVYTTGLPENGTLETPLAPGNVTVAVSFKTGYTGRSYRGRAYQIGLVKDQLDDDHLAGTLATDLKDAWELLRAGGFASMGAYQCIVSYCHNKAWRTEALVTDVASTLVEDTLDSQRRRLAGRGA